MQERNLRITIYGFWDDFGMKSIPRDGKIYFVFAGVIVGQNRCHLLRTVRIGTDVATVSQNSPDDLNPGELFFYAVGDAPDEDIDELVFALRKQFTPSLVLDEDLARFKDLSLRVHMEGKIPGIYSGFVDFAIGDAEGGAK